MDKELAEVAIGAFLHDIGKISQRAKVKLSAQSERIKHLVCPTAKAGYSTHVHAVYTNDFFENMKGWLPKELDPDRIANLASYHHRPNNPVETIVQQADWLSAGQDRREGEDESDSQLEKGYMRSIFTSLGSGGGGEISRIPIIPQTLGLDCFPQQGSQDTAATEDYSNQFELACRYLQALTDASLALYLEQLRWTFSLYAWNIPSSLMDARDISLLDHSLTTAAFSTALHQYHTQNGTMEIGDICDWNTRKFRLVTGDLSGIQSYIFHFSQEHPQGVSKRLRSRSFYLGLLTQLAGQLILDELGLPCFNRIIDAGGRFTLLVANTPATLDKLAVIEKKFHEWFFNTYHGLLNLNLSYDMELRGEDFRSVNFQKTQRQIGWNIEKAKMEHFSSRFKARKEWAASSFEHPYDLREYNAKEEEFFTMLGSILPHVGFLLIGREGCQPEGAIGQEYHDSEFIRPFGNLAINFSKSPPGPKELPSLRCIIQFVPGVEQLDFGQIVNGQFIANYVPKQTQADARLYNNPKVENWFPRDELEEDGSGKDFAVYNPGGAKTFAHLASDSLTENSKGELKGIPLLGILKADVDRLGMLFAKGLGEKSSIGRFASLSRQLDLYFRGFLPNLMLSPPPEANSEFRNIYTVYAGGDDLLLVGPWRTMFDFAGYLNDSFSRYVCKNPSVTISAGLVLSPHRYPLSQTALEAEEALDKAKHGGRNRICVFDTVLGWKSLTQAIDDGRFLDHAMNEGAGGIRLGKGFVYRLLEYHKMARDTTNIVNRKWRSHLAYDISRNVKILDSKRDGKPEGLLRIEKITGLTADRSEIERLKVSATYCLYLNRGGSL